MQGGAITARDVVHVAVAAAVIVGKDEIATTPPETIVETQAVAVNAFMVRTIHPPEGAITLEGLSGAVPVRVRLVESASVRLSYGGGSLP